MELCQQIIIEGLARGELVITLSSDAREWVQERCLRTLMKIKEVLEDPELEDEACFLRIEGIIDAFEELGCTIMNRHDFG